MMHRRQFLSASALAASSLAMPAPLRAASARNEDIRLLGKLLRTIHPGLHRYLSPARFEAGLTRLDREWNANPSLESRFLNLTRFLATIRCGHSYPSFFNQKRVVADRLFSRRDRLPFAFRWIDGRMVVTANHSTQVLLPPGSVIKEIEGVPTETILGHLMPYARADGSNDGKRRMLLSISGADPIEAFDVLYGLRFGAPRNSRFAVRYRPPGAQRDSQLSLGPIDLATRKAFISTPDPRSNQPIWQWYVDSSGLARLTMPSWAMFNSTWDWQSWLDDRLDSLRGARGLIVDLRENEGGNDCGNAILARLVATDIVLPKVDRLVRYRKLPDALNPHLDTWDDSFRDWGETARPFNDRFLRLERGDGDRIIAAKGPRIDIPLAVLISPQNSSATFQFASLIKSTGLGMLIGETTGGNRRGINGGAFVFARLPESGIEFDLPLIGYYPVEPQPDAGIEPDLVVTNSAADIAVGFDRVLETARRQLLR